MSFRSCCFWSLCLFLSVAKTFRSLSWFVHLICCCFFLFLPRVEVVKNLIFSWWAETLLYQINPPSLILRSQKSIKRMNKNPRIDFLTPSLATVSASADGELNEDDIFAIDISHALPRHSPSSSPSLQHHPPARQLQRSKSGLKNVEASGILAALPESSGNNSYLSHVFHHKPAAALSTSVSSTASSSSSSGGGASAASSSSARAIPTAPKPPQERLPFAASFIGGGKYPQSAPVQVPLVSSAMMNRHKKEFKLTDVVDADEEEEEEGEMLPPHEIVARSLAQSSLLSCSVLEGAGRTLKGRDLRQVRNAVFRRTGFID